MDKVDKIIKHLDKKVDYILIEGILGKVYINGNPCNMMEYIDDRFGYISSDDYIKVYFWLANNKTVINDKIH